MKHLAFILTFAVTAASIVAGCANYAYGTRPKIKYTHKANNLSHKTAKVIHPKTEPTPDFNTYGHSYTVAPDGSWRWLEAPSPTPAPRPTVTPRPQSF